MYMRNGLNFYSRCKQLNQFFENFESFQPVSISGCPKPPLPPLKIGLTYTSEALILKGLVTLHKLKDLKEKMKINKYIKNNYH